MTAFTALGLSDPILKVLSELSFEQPTDIQQKAIPQLLKNDCDFIGLAQTGTGKTAAFGLPLLERIDINHKKTQALVLAPTRELGQQIAQQLNAFSKYLPKLNVLAVYGGQAISTQIKALKKPQHIIIATPGRLIDLSKRKAVKLNDIEVLVLDEADEMLNMGFKDELDEILTYTSEDKLTWLFSATMPKAIKRIVDNYMHNPVEVRIDAQNKVNTNIEHQFVMVRQPNKTVALIRFLDINPNMRGLVFCRTKRDTQNLAEELLKRNYKADALHGDLSQHQRDRVMKRFKAHHLQVLIATDVAARGIDVNDLTHVFHFTLPEDMSYYTHRSGRTARAGKEGISIAFVNGREKFKINRLQKQLGISFKQILVPNMDEVLTVRIESWCNNLLNQKANGKANAVLTKNVYEYFESISKEELLDRLLSRELSIMRLNNTGDLNDVAKGNRRERRNERQRGKHKHRDGRSRNSKDSKNNRGKYKDRNKDDFSLNKKKKKKGGKPRFFINLGKRDEIAKKDLLNFICKVGNLKKADVGTIDMHNSHSFFEVDEKTSKKINHQFKDIELGDGRALRVNRDN